MMILLFGLNLGVVFAGTEFIAEIHKPADSDIIAPEELSEARSQAWSEYAEAELSDNQLLEGTTVFAMNFGEATMYYMFQVVG